MDTDTKTDADTEMDIGYWIGKKFYTISNIISYSVLFDCLISEVPISHIMLSPILFVKDIGLNATHGFQNTNPTRV
jgi:hypothetical protein